MNFVIFVYSTGKICRRPTTQPNETCHDKK